MLATTINSIEDNNPAFTMIGYHASKYNALKHGILSKYTVMQWENREDYDSLLSSLINDYAPKNTTEEHLVEELAGIIWRKMRLKYAEMSNLQSSLSRNVGKDSFCSSNDSAKDALLASSYEVEKFDIKKAILASDNDNLGELKIAKECLECCLVAAKILEETNSYEDGLAALHKEDQNNWYTDWLDDENDISSATAEGLLSWIRDNTNYYKKRIYEIENRSKVKQQILGKSFLSKEELDKYARYESHLDRKFEKILVMLIKLQDIRISKSL